MSVSYSESEFNPKKTVTPLIAEVYFKKIRSDALMFLYYKSLIYIDYIFA